MISEVFKKIDKYEAEKLVSQLVRIPSENPPGEEEEIAEFISEKFRDIGLDVEKQYSKPKRPNVVAYLKGEIQRPVLMLNGHLDTVPIGDISLWSVDPFAGIVKEGKVYGRGAADMKGGLASMILAAKAIKDTDNSIKGNLILTMAVDEEIYGIGTRDLLKKGFRADAAIAGECTGLRLHNSHKGILNLEISVFGKSAHASMPNEGLNAIYKMSKICLALEKYQEALRKSFSPEQDYPTISVGTIQGGIKTNVIPNLCKTTVDRRLLPGEHVDKARGDLESILKKMSIDDPDLKFSYRQILHAEPSMVSKKERIMNLMENAMKEMKLEAKATCFPATSDMRFLVNQAKIPTALFGPGDINLAHVEDEYVEISQVIDAAKVYSHVALSMLT